jgi:hypothetical protein
MYLSLMYRIREQARSHRGTVALFQ